MDTDNMTNFEHMLIGTTEGIKPLMELNVCDIIAGYDINTKQMIASAVVDVRDYVHPICYTITADNDDFLVIPGDQPLWDPVEECWVALDPDAAKVTHAGIDTKILTNASHLLRPKGGTASIKHIGVGDCNVPFRVFEMDAVHTYWLSGYLAHNSTSTSTTTAYYTGGAGGTGAGVNGSTTASDGGAAASGTYTTQTVTGTTQVAVVEGIRW